MRTLRDLESDIELTNDPMEDQSLDPGGGIEVDSND
jgi:hypothetical protein